ncbi:hypothetical protein psal_cds_685 [Pandoravirus salinus]|uniref:Uncharacterized protein n=1 Tax=Pandoravirus salinus TaxID=1349410 RepID=S4VVH2_9VIRU|nr:hypothetical protein psal_cds_685 [Pandoravirus salinus]AGO84624.1 hypothetical protein psal_cds_685 [Pandoravirus salinus]
MADTTRAAPFDEDDRHSVLDAAVARLIDDGAMSLAVDDLAVVWPGDQRTQNISPKALFRSIERVGGSRCVEIVGLRDTTTGRYFIERIDPATVDLASLLQDAVGRRLQCHVARLHIRNIPQRYWGSANRVRASGRLERAIVAVGPAFGCRVACVLESAAPVFCLDYEPPTDGDGDVGMNDN